MVVAQECAPLSALSAMRKHREIRLNCGDECHHSRAGGALSRATVYMIAMIPQVKFISLYRNKFKNIGLNFTISKLYS